MCNQLKAFTGEEGCLQVALGTRAAVSALARVSSLPCGFRTCQPPWSVSQFLKIPLALSTHVLLALLLRGALTDPEISWSGARADVETTWAFSRETPSYRLAGARGRRPLAGGAVTSFAKWTQV